MVVVEVQRQAAPRKATTNCVYIDYLVELQCNTVVVSSESCVTDEHQSILTDSNIGKIEDTLET